MNIVTRLIPAAVALLAFSGVLPAANTVGLKLEGTWLVTVNVNAPAPGIPSFSFTALSTFLSNGGFITSQGSNATPQIPPATPPVLVHVGSGLGEWVLVGDHLFVATVYQFRFDQSNQFVGLMRIRQSITLSPTLDQFTATFSGDIYDVSGNLTTTVSGMAKATRVDVLYPDNR